MSFFSVNAIAEMLRSDHDINYYLYQEYYSTKVQNSEEKSLYSEKILQQLLERKFLKPIWKTIYEYKNFMIQNFSPRSIPKIEEIINKDQNTTGTIVRAIQTKTNIEPGNIFIINRSNKFYSMNKNNDFYIGDSGQWSTPLESIMPQRDFNQKFSSIAFYIFTLGDKKSEVERAFVEIIRSKQYLLSTPQI